MYPPNFIYKTYTFDITNLLTVENAVSLAPSPTSPGNSFSMAKDFKDPSVQEWNLNLERNLGENTLLTIAYIGNVSRHVESRADVNQPYALSPGDTSGILDVRPDPNINGVLSHGPYSMANYNALAVKAERRFRNGLQFLASYTWSKAMNLTDGDNWGLEDYYNPKLSYAVSGWDRTNNFILSGVYQLPIGTGARFASSDNWFNKQVIGGWRLSGIQRLATGEPIAITAVNNADTSPYVVNFANLACNPNEGFVRTRFQIFNASCFVQPANGVYGRGGRDAVREPRLNDIDLSLAKTFRLTERQQLEFRAEAFSAFNHPNFGANGGNAGTPGLGQVSYATGQRVGQFALRYSF